MPKNAYQDENKNMFKIHKNYFLVPPELQKCWFRIVNQHQFVLYSLKIINMEYYTLCLNV